MIQAQLQILKVFFSRVWHCEKICVLSGKSFLLTCVSDLLVLLKHGAFHVSLFLQEVFIQISVNNMFFFKACNNVMTFKDAVYSRKALRRWRSCPKILVNPGSGLCTFFGLLDLSC